LLGGCDRGGLSYADGLADPEVTVVSERSVQIGTEVFVLAGVDLPKPAPQARCWAEALLAREARMALDGLVRGSQRVHTQQEQRLPSGEMAAQVEVNGEDLSEALVQAGFAVRSNGKGFEWCGPVDVAAEGSPELGYSAEPPLESSPSSPG
jgi:endonuclease YncB( thermonuclease family)